MVALDREAEDVAGVAAALARQPRPLRLRGTVRPYAWGGTRFIPELIGLEPPAGQPAAELWLGAHPTAPATVLVDEREIPLNRLIEASPETILGRHVVARFDGQLPYLLKILDVAGMLSIQAHPSRAQAVEGFDRDTRRGLAIGAPDRSYRDRCHKPEMQVALTEFWMLHGFRDLVAAQAALDGIDEFASLASRLRSASASPGAPGPLRQLYEHVMTLPQSEVDRILAPLAGRLAPLSRTARPDRSDPRFWAARAFDQFPLPDGHLDRGIVSIFLMNLVRLEPGRATFIDAGVLHAYLEGVAVEIMASSDNVLRGGLTPKHVDVPELMRVVSVESAPPTFVTPVRRSSTELVFSPPVEEFELSRVSATANRPHYAGPTLSADTLIVIEGSGQVRVAERVEPLERGSCILIPHGAAYAVETASELTLFRGGLPQSGTDLREPAPAS